MLCYQTYTTPATHQLIRDNMHLSVHIQETRKGPSLSVSILFYSIKADRVRYRPAILSVARGESHQVSAERSSSCLARA